MNVFVRGILCYSDVHHDGIEHTAGFAECERTGIEHSRGALYDGSMRFTICWYICIYIYSPMCFNQHWRDEL